MSIFTVQPTTTITIGETVFNVADHSDQVKSLVALYDLWRQNDVDLTNESQKIKAALNTLEQQLVQLLQTEAQERAAQVAANDSSETTVEA